MFDTYVKSLMSFSSVILAEAGIQLYHMLMAFRLHGNDRIWTFYRFIIFKKSIVLFSIICPILILFNSTLLTAVAQESQRQMTISIEPELKDWKIKGPKFMSKWEVGIAAMDTNNPKKLKVQATDKKAGELINKSKGSLDIYTRKTFGDCIIEMEVMVAEKSNSGIYLMGRYEIQVKDSFGKSWLLGPGDMGGIVGTSKPIKNAAKKAGQWQKIKIEFNAPRLKNGKRQAPAEFVKVTLNDTVVQEHVKMENGPTSGALKNGEISKGPLMLQGGLGAVAYRNIRITPKVIQ